MIFCRKKTLDSHMSVSAMRNARRKSPVLPRRPERGDKTATLLTTPQSSSTLTANSNLTLPATPSSHSICLSTTDINHINVPPSTPSTPVPSTAAAAAAAAAAAVSMDISLTAVKPNEDQSLLDDDPVYIFNNINRHYDSNDNE